MPQESKIEESSSGFKNLKKNFLEQQVSKI